MSNFTRENNFAVGKCKICNQETVTMYHICENCSVDGDIRREMKEKPPVSLQETTPVYKKSKLIGLYEVKDGQCTLYHVPSVKLIKTIKKNILPQTLRGG